MLRILVPLNCFLRSANLYRSLRHLGDKVLNGILTILLLILEECSDDEDFRKSSISGLCSLFLLYVLRTDGSMEVDGLSFNTSLTSSTSFWFSFECSRIFFGVTDSAMKTRK